MIWNASLSIVLALISGVALGDAANRFTFSVESIYTGRASSGAGKLWICSAGIGSRSGAGEGGPHRGGDNYLTARYRLSPSEGVRVETLESSVGDIGAAPSLKFPLDGQVESIDFELSSNQYGAWYFVDVCYLAPDIDYLASKLRVDYKLVQNSLTYSDVRESSGAGSYFRLADVTVDARTVCDSQLTGDKRGPPDDTDDLFPMDSDVVFDPSPVALGQSTQTVSFLGSDGQHLNHNEQRQFNAPRVCKIRYLVVENSDAQRNASVVSGQFTSNTEIAIDYLQ